MKRYILLWVILIFLFPVNLIANGQDENSIITSRNCIPLKDLNLSDNQQKAINKIDVIYGEKILKLRCELTSNQLELKDLLRDPSASEEIIRVGGKKIEALQAQLQREVINYQLEIRRILIPEQTRLWCTIEGYPVNKGLKR